MFHVNTSFSYQQELFNFSPKETYYNPELEELSATKEDEEDCIPLSDRGLYFPPKNKKEEIAVTSEPVQNSSPPRRVSGKAIAEKGITHCGIGGSVDNKQAVKALTLLGYKRGDSTTVALQPPPNQELSGWPSYTIKLNFDCDNFSITKNSDGSTKEDGLGFLTYMSRLGWQVHWLPNSHLGGTGRDKLQQLNALYWEIDDSPYDYQWKVIEKLTTLGLEPTMVASSGGRSLHCYLAIEPLEPTPENKNRWLTTERLLIAVTNGDSAVATINHSLRLPGFIRHGKKPQQISHLSNKTYTLEQVENLLLQALPYGMSEDRWHDYKNDKGVLSIPETELPSVVKRATIQPKKVVNLSLSDNGYYQALTTAIEKINEAATVDDFTDLGFIPGKGKSGSCPLHGKTNKGTSAALSTYNGSLVFGCFKCQEHGLTYTALKARLETGKPYWEGKLFVERVEQLCNQFGVMLPDRVDQSVARTTPETTPETNKPTVVKTGKTVETRPNQTVIDGKIYPGLVKELPPADITVIATPMGSGKTRVAAREYREMADAQNVPFVYLSMLISLAASASEVISIAEAKDYSWGDTHVAGCIHSFRESSGLGARLLPILDECIWSGRKPIIFIDEIKAVIERLFCTDTNLLNERREIIDTLIKYLPFCQLVVADAQADDFTINLLKQIIEYGSYREKEVSTHWVVSETPTKLKQVYVFPLTNADLKKTKPGTPLRLLIDQVKRDRGFHLLNLTGQQVTSKTGVNSTRVVQKVLARKGIKALVIDRETVSEGGLAGDFMRNPTGVAHHAKKLGYQVIIASPIMKTGVSIDDLDPKKPLLDGVWSLEMGLSAPDMVAQNQIRCRNLTVPRYLFIANTGFNFIGNRSTKPELVKHDESVAAQKIWDLYQYQLQSDADQAVTHFLLDAHCEIAARINREMFDYRNEVMKRINELAETVSFELPDQDGFNTLALSGDEITEMQKEEYQEVLAAEHQAICDAREINQEEYQELKKEKSLTREDGRIIKKYEIERTTGTKINPEHVHNAETGFYRALTNYYRAGKGFLFQDLKDKSKLSKAKNRDIVRENKTTNKPKADFNKMLLELGFEGLINEQSLTNSSTAVVSVVKKLLDMGLIREQERLVMSTDYTPLTAKKQELSVSKTAKKSIQEELKAVNATLKETREGLRTGKQLAIKQIKENYLESVRQVRALKLNKEERTVRLTGLREERDNQITQIRQETREIIDTTKKQVTDIISYKQELKFTLISKKQEVADVRERLTKKYETRTGYAFTGDLSLFLGEFTAQSHIEVIDKIIQSFGFKLVKVDRLNGERVYQVKSCYTDVDGNYICDPGEIHPNLLDHWYTRDLLSTVSDLLSNGDNRVKVTREELNFWLNSNDARLQPLISKIKSKN